MNRREIIKRGAFGAGALAIAGPGILLEQGCSPKNVSFYVQTVSGALVELKPLLPGAAALISEAVKVASDFDAAYKAGNFVSASAIFANLTSLLSQIASDVGVTDPTVKIGLAVAGVALHAIAALLVSQSTQPAVVAARRSASREQMAQASLIDRLGNTAAVDQVFVAVKP